MSSHHGSDSSVAVRAAGLTRAFDNVAAVDGLDLDVVAGQVHALVGLNGAGKSTLMRLLVACSSRMRAVPSCGASQHGGHRLRSGPASATSAADAATPSSPSPNT